LIALELECTWVITGLPSDRRVGEFVALRRATEEPKSAMVKHAREVLAISMQDAAYEPS
jgi:hypothetical protein